MSGWRSIGEPDVQSLTPLEKQVKRYLDKGYHPNVISCIIKQSREQTRDLIYEIRKKEGIMRKATVSEDEKRTMKMMQAEGKTVREIAEATGRGLSTVDRIVNDRKPAKINPEFYAAVDAMIAQSKAVDAEKKSANAEPEKIPHVIRCALDDQCSEINMELETREQRIAELQEEIAKLQKKKHEIQEWMEARTREH